MLFAMDIEVSPAVNYAVEGILSYARKGLTGPGGRLPSERALSQDLRVSRTTLRSALQELENAGVISGRPQSGWYVTDDRTVADNSTELESFTEIAGKRGFTPSSRVLRFVERPATLDESERLRIPPASPILELRRVRLLDDVPTCVDTAVLPVKLCGALRDETFERASLYERLQTVCGVDIERTTCILRAHGASQETAEYLNLDPGESLLELDSTGYAKDGTPILISVLDYRGDAYRFAAELSRIGSFPAARV
jgi:GntR family transcriptional regulator